MKNQKGITLVALIITVIVMLILAGAVITMALSDRNIFKITQNAATAYQNKSENIDAQIDYVENMTEKLEYNYTHAE